MLICLWVGQTQEKSILPVVDESWVNKRISGTTPFYLLACCPFPTPSSYVSCIVPNLFQCPCVPVYWLSLLSLNLDVLVACTEHEEGKQRCNLQRNRIRPTTTDNFCLCMAVPGRWRESLLFSCQSLVKHVGNVHPQPSCLSKLVDGHVTFEWHI